MPKLILNSNGSSWLTGGNVGIGEPITSNNKNNPDGRTYGGLLAEDVAAKGPKNADGIPLFAGLDLEGRPDDVAYPHLAARSGFLPTAVVVGHVAEEQPLRLVVYAAVQDDVDETDVFRPVDRPAVAGIESDHIVL